MRLDTGIYTDEYYYVKLQLMLRHVDMQARTLDRYSQST